MVVTVASVECCPPPCVDPHRSTEEQSWEGLSWASGQSSGGWKSVGARGGGGSRPGLKCASPW